MENSELLTVVQLKFTHEKEFYLFITCIIMTFNTNIFFILIDFHNFHVFSSAHSHAH